MFTFGMALLSSISTGFGAFVGSLPMLIFGIILYFVAFLALLCGNLTKKVPINYILLFVFTLGESIVVAAMTA